MRRKRSRGAEGRRSGGDTRPCHDTVAHGYDKKKWTREGEVKNNKQEVTKGVS